MSDENRENRAQKNNAGSMNLPDYLQDQSLLLFLHLGCMFLLTVFLRLTGYPADYSILILLCWCLLLAVWLSARFLERRRYFRKMEEILENLDQRYLLGELMPCSFRLEDRLYRTLIQKSNKSVIERIHRVEDARQEYREYIESWVHEIKAPITGIALYCENHRNEGSRYIASENRKIENDVDMALYYARSDEVYKDYLIAKTSLQEVAEEVLMKNRQYLISRRIRAEVSCPDPVFTDRKWMSFILNQLVLNSAKYGREENACMQITTEQTEKSVLFRVKDNGVGIRPEELPRIFEKGFTGTNGRRPEERATGMGLYLCRKLCEKLGIEIRAVSADGEGTEMILEFPVSSYLAGYREEGNLSLLFTGLGASTLPLRSAPIVCHWHTAPPHGPVR